MVWCVMEWELSFPSSLRAVRKSWLQQHCNKYNNFHFDLSQMPFTLFGKKKSFECINGDLQTLFYDYILKWCDCCICITVKIEMSKWERLGIAIEKVLNANVANIYWSWGSHSSHSQSNLKKACGVFRIEDGDDKYDQSVYWCTRWQKSPEHKYRWCSNTNKNRFLISANENLYFISTVSLQFYM